MTDMKPDAALIYAALRAVEKRGDGPVFDLQTNGFSLAQTWHCARWLIDRRMLAGEYGLSDTGAVTYVHIHGLTGKGRVLLEQLQSQLSSE